MRCCSWTCVTWSTYVGNRYGWLVAVDQHTDYTVFAPCSLWQKGRVEQLSRKWRTRRFGNFKWRVSAVSPEVVHVGIKEREVGNSPVTRVFGQQMKVYGELTEHGKGHFPFRPW